METIEHIKWNRDYHRNGQLWWERSYIKDKPHGLGRDWHENGQLWCEIPYVDGKLHGLTRSWYSDGSLYVVWLYNEGELLLRVTFPVGKIFSLTKLTSSQWKQLNTTEYTEWEREYRGNGQ